MNTDLIHTTSRRTSTPRVVTGAVMTGFGAVNGPSGGCDAARTRRDRRDRWVVTANTMKQVEFAVRDQKKLFAAQDPLSSREMRGVMPGPVTIRLAIFAGL